MGIGHIGIGAGIGNIGVAVLQLPTVIKKRVMCVWTLWCDGLVCPKWDDHHWGFSWVWRQTRCSGDRLLLAIRKNHCDLLCLKMRVMLVQTATDSRGGVVVV